MSELRVTVIPVGRVDVAEVEGALARVTKVIHKPIELREPAPLPRAGEDSSRGQHGAAELLAALRLGAPRLAVVKLVGGAASEGQPVPIPSPDAMVFVTDVDLFTPSTDGVFMHVTPAQHAGLVSVRRLREAFYRRRADPKRQRARLVKEILRAIGRAAGLPNCPDPACVVSPTQALPDIDRKAERFCSACWRRLSTGSIRI